MVAENGDEDVGKTATGQIADQFQLGDESEGGGGLIRIGTDELEINGGLRDAAVRRSEESEGRAGDRGVEGWEFDQFHEVENAVEVVRVVVEVAARARDLSEGGDAGDWRLSGRSGGGRGQRAGGGYRGCERQEKTEGKY